MRGSLPVIPPHPALQCTFSSDRKKCMEAGMTGYIAKPISLDEITTTLREETPAGR